MQSYIWRASVYSCGQRFSASLVARAPKAQTGQLRLLHNDGRRRLSEFWVPTGGIAPVSDSAEDSQSMLIRGGFVRQAHAGLFQFLPLGLRIQEKLERLLDKHMVKLGASKVSLSTFSSVELWKRSGRLNGSSSELFRLSDRKGIDYLLSPTHEEEITSLVGSIVKSYKELPLRLYQISRKYRDEARPRQGLLRTREFLMKDLYTFDSTKEKALQTYETIRQAYAAFFNEFKIPYLTAEADSGEIGGDLSHEYHFPTSKGEDNIISCTSCTYVTNEELTESLGSATPRTTLYDIEVGLKTDPATPEPQINGQYDTWIGVSRDRLSLIQAVFPKQVTMSREARINPFMMKKLFPDLDLGVESPRETFIEYWQTVKETGAMPGVLPQLKRVYDHRVPRSYCSTYNLTSTGSSPALNLSIAAKQTTAFDEGTSPDLLRIETNDKCPKCKSGSLKVQSTVELGHTFFLGTRYSDPLNITVAADHSMMPSQSNFSDRPPAQPDKVALQMGCHGIGVSRMIAAVADSLADTKGLNWPRVMAPFEVVIVPTPENELDATKIWDNLTGDTSSSDRIDAILDDRDKAFAWKLKDADLIGYPIIVVLGRAWKKGRKCEVQCRRLDSLRQEVSQEELQSFVISLLDRL